MLLLFQLLHSAPDDVALQANIFHLTDFTLRLAWHNLVSSSSKHDKGSRKVQLNTIIWLWYTKQVVERKHASTKSVNLLNVLGLLSCKRETLVMDAGLSLGLCLRSSSYQGQACTIDNTKVNHPTWGQELVLSRGSRVELSHFHFQASVLDALTLR